MDLLSQTTGFTLWFTGMGGAGKTVIAGQVYKRLHAIGRRVELLDNEEAREVLAKGLGVSKEDRDTQVRRLGYIAKLLTRNDGIAIVATVSPYREARDQVRREVKRFVEVFVDCPLETLIARDKPGNYKKAMAGELKNVPGIDDPYEPPTHAELVIHTDKESVEVAVGRVFQTLVDCRYIGPTEFGKLTGGQRPKRNAKPAQAARKGSRKKLAAKAAARKAPKKMAARTAAKKKSRR
jgi:adenylyl-sulfate kinase